jgi:ATP-dependent Clp protease protease subunit
MDFGKEFEKYYVKHLGKGSLDIHNYTNHIESSLTPYILEEREMKGNTN